MVSVMVTFSPFLSSFHCLYQIVFVVPYQVSFVHLPLQVMETPVAEKLFHKKLLKGIVNPSCQVRPWVG